MFVYNFLTNQSSAFSIVDNVVVERQLNIRSNAIWRPWLYLNYYLKRKEEILKRKQNSTFCSFYMQFVRMKVREFGGDGRVPVITLKLVFYPHLETDHSINIFPSLLCTYGCELWYMYGRYREPRAG